MKSFCLLFAESFNDTILLVLIAAAIVSLITGIIEDAGKVISIVDKIAILRVLETVLNSGAGATSQRRESYHWTQGIFLSLWQSFSLLNR